MSFAVTFLIVSGAVIVYYAGMIAYDLYAAKWRRRNRRRLRKFRLTFPDSLKGLSRGRLTALTRMKNLSKRNRLCHSLHGAFGRQNEQPDGRCCVRDTQCRIEEHSIQM